MLAIGLFFVRVLHVGHKITRLAVQAFAQRLNGAGVNPSGLLAEQFAAGGAADHFLGVQLIESRTIRFQDIPQTAIIHGHNIVPPFSLPLL